MPIFMNYDGIPGSVTAAGHEKWIELGSLQFGVGRGIASPSSAGSDREASAPSVSEIVVTKDLDAASTGLFKASLYGEGKLVKIDLVKTDKDKLEPYLQLELESTMVSGFSVSSGGDRPTESVSLNFTKITYTNTSMGTNNETGDPDRAFWDLAQATGG